MLQRNSVTLTLVQKLWVDPVLFIVVHTEAEEVRLLLLVNKHEII